ncbi:sigma-70 family RNA polymerase sigma factor [bacterium]|nr:sigma-70 family RNA polymerase sigma factor [bacterium]
MVHEEFNPVALYLREIGPIPLLSREEERELFEKAGRGNEEAKDTIIKANLKLVVKIAKKYARLGLPFMDLVEEGNLGLMRAAEKFDLTKGCKFSTYASWWIKQFIMRALANQGKTIRLPVYMVDRIAKIERVIGNFKNKNSRDPSIQEIAEMVSLPEKKIVQVFNIARATESISARVGEDQEVIETLQDTSAIQAEKVIANVMLQEELIDLLSHLKPREMEVLSKRFGLDGDAPMKLKDIGAQLDISRERVRQIEQVALRKLKKIMKSKSILYTDF